MADAVASTPPALTALVAETPSTGLTSDQVAERRSRGLANAGGERTSRSVGKRAGDRLLSGSFVIAGSGGYQATGVGADAYARKLAAQARRFALVRSELMDGINRILRYVTWAIGPVAVLLVISGWHAHGNMRQVASGTVAALVGMVPQGLVLLTSVAFGVAAVTLARRRQAGRCA